MQDSKSTLCPKRFSKLNLNGAVAQCKLRRYVELNDREADEAKVHEGLRESARLENVDWGWVMKEVVVVDEVEHVGRPYKGMAGKFDSLISSSSDNIKHNG